MGVPAKPKRPLKPKPNSLNWEQYNLLENLFLFCVHKGDVVPKDSAPGSRVHFRVSRKPNDESESICILFRIDNQSDPLIRESRERRPDFLALYMDSEKCIFTIIEMKGGESKGTARGIDQILAFRQRLIQEFAKHFPLGNRAHFQAILLCPPLADIPRKKIADEQEHGFHILPLQCACQAELFPYISKCLDDKDTKYIHQSLTAKEGYGYLEDMLINRSCRHRKGRKWEYGFSITYKLTDSEYANLLYDGEKCVVQVKQNADSAHIKTLGEHLRQFPSLKKIPVEPLTGG